MSNSNLAIILALFISLTSCISNNNKSMKKEEGGKVTGLGGIFFKVEDPQKTRDWYKNNLGFVTNEYGSLFHTKNTNGNDEYCQWSPFANTTTYFEPAQKNFMINLRVDNLEILLEKFKVNGVIVLDTIKTYEYGKFLHVLDNEQNKIELWEPVDSEFTRSYAGQTTDNILITGITFTSKNPEALKVWYKNNLGIVFSENISELPFKGASDDIRSFNFNFEPVSEIDEILSNFNKTFYISYTVPDSLKINNSITHINSELYQDDDLNLFKLVYK